VNSYVVVRGITVDVMRSRRRHCRAKTLRGFVIFSSNTIARPRSVMSTLHGRRSGILFCFRVTTIYRGEFIEFYYSLVWSYSH